LLPPCDFVCFLLAGYISTLLFPVVPIGSTILVDRDTVALIGALLAPFILYNQQFGATAGRGEARGLFSSFAMRFALRERSRLRQRGPRLRHRPGHARAGTSHRSFGYGAVK
jgi:hypothetical protein